MPTDSSESVPPAAPAQPTGNQPPLPELGFEDTATAYAHRSTPALKRSLVLFKSLRVRALAQLGPPLLETALNLGLPIRGLVRRYFYDQFVGGRELGECELAIQKLHTHGVRSILDYAVEAEQSTAGFDRVTAEVKRIIDYAKAHPAVPFVAMKLSGLGPMDVLRKRQAGEALGAHEQEQYDALRARLEALCQYALERGQSVYIDAEESWTQEETDALCEEMMIRFNRELPIVYTTVQMYRKDRLAYVKALFRRVRQRQAIPGVKLVRGAYLEKENQRAARLGYATPIQPNKAATDRDFNLALAYILERLDTFGLCLGTHNEDSCRLAAGQLEASQHPTDHPHLWISQLYGMADHISLPMAAAGYNVAKYLPYGPLEASLPYLMRRAQENSSVAGQTPRELQLIRRELARRQRNGAYQKFQ